MFDQLIEQRRGQPERGYAISFQEVFKLPEVRKTDRGHNQLGAMQQRAPQLEAWKHRTIPSPAAGTHDPARSLCSRFRTRDRAMEVCRIATPFGCPVEPEVYIT